MNKSDCWQQQHITLAVSNISTLHWLLTTATHYTGCWQHQHNKLDWLFTAATQNTTMAVDNINTTNKPGCWEQKQSRLVTGKTWNNTLLWQLTSTQQISLAVDDKNKAAWLLTTSKQQTGLTVGNSNQINWTGLAARFLSISIKTNRLTPDTISKSKVTNSEG